MKRHRLGPAKDTEDPAAAGPKQTQHASIEPLLTVEQVAAILGVSKRTVMRMIADGRLKKVKGLGRAVRLHPRTLRNLENAE